jgi:hypothetical protein
VAQDGFQRQLGATYFLIPIPGCERRKHIMGVRMAPDDMAGAGDLDEFVP